MDWRKSDLCIQLLINSNLVHCTVLASVSSIRHYETVHVWGKKGDELAMKVSMNIKWSLDVSRVKKHF